MADATGPLAGLKVVDVTHMLAGPYCTWLLGSLGADIVKVEHPERATSRALSRRTVRE